MKLIIITDAWFPQVNGVVRTYEHLSAELESMDHEVKVVGPRDFPMRIPLLSYPEIKLAIKPYARLKRIIEEYQPTHIHISTEGPLGWAGRRYCAKHNRKFSTSYHTQFPDYVAKRVAYFLPFLYDFVHRQSIKYVRKFHSRSSAMMVATNSLEETLRSWGFKNPIHRLTRGADLNQFYPGKKTKYKNNEKPVALYVGRIAIEKNIEAFLKMDWEGTKVLVGDGPIRAHLEEKYPDAVFVGPKTGKDLAAYYRSADVFVFPSKTDTFGMVLVEALASGIPVAAYNVTGPKDIITEDFLGALTEDNLGDAALKALSKGTPEQRAKHVKSAYTWENAARQFEDAQLNKISQ